MKSPEIIESKLNRLPPGYVFTYSDFLEKVESKEAVIKALNRMAVAGKIKKLSKGKFYKEEETPFGTLEPSQKQVVKDLLERNGKIEGYLTGLSIYNQLGLTTQVSNVIQIGKNDIRSSFERGRNTISFLKQKNTITKENIPLLQILDSIRSIKKIPDTSVSAACERLKEIISKLSSNEQDSLVRLALKYPPASRALLGAIFDEIRIGEKTERLKRSLNPVSTYKIHGASTALATTEEWRIT